MKQQTKEQTAEILTRIAELRVRYLKLIALCGRNGVSTQTIEEYAEKIKRLQEQLN
jgi:hypothetical protein